MPFEAWIIASTLDVSGEERLPCRHTEQVLLVGVHQHGSDFDRGITQATVLPVNQPESAVGACNDVGEARVRAAETEWCGVDSVRWTPEC